MAADKAIRLFLHTLKEQCIHLDNEVRSLQAFHYPSSASETLVKCILECTNRLRSKINELSQQAISEAVPIEEIKAESAAIQTFLRFLTSELCPVIRNSSISQVPAEIVQPAERIALGLFPNCQIIINAVHEQNYYFIKLGEKISRMFGIIDSADILDANNFKKDLFFLKLCLKPPCGVLNHSILGHELGHELYIEKQIIRHLSPHIRFNNADVINLSDYYVTRFNAEAQAAGLPSQIPLGQTSQYIQYQLRRTLLESAVNWIKEIFCDIIGVGLFGPAFICAQSIMFLPFDGIDYCTNEYPPDRLRVQLAIKSLIRSDPGYGYRKSRRYSDLIAILIDPWKEYVGTTPHEPDELFYKIVFRAVYDMRDTIIDQAKNSLNDRYYRYSQIEKEANPLRNRILDGLPPNEFQSEIGDAFITANLQSILNAGWMCYLEDMQAFNKLMPSLDEDDITARFFGLLSKGIEASEMQITWNESISMQ